MVGKAEVMRVILSRRAVSIPEAAVYQKRQHILSTMDGNDL
jgi:hypothetical protein